MVVKKSVKSTPKSKSYLQMSRKERKVAIAKDVIKNLDVMKVKSGNGYVVPDYNSNFCVEDLLKFGITPQQIAEKVKFSCTVCARGAMMLCKVGKFNHFGFGKIEFLDDINDENTFDALEDAFTEDELFEIENAFESGPHVYWSNIQDDKDRLRAIMQSIIDNNGKFDPSIEYEIYYK